MFRIKNGSESGKRLRAHETAGPDLLDSRVMNEGEGETRTRNLLFTRQPLFDPFELLRRVTGIY
jgi:hypothetical protein